MRKLRFLYILIVVAVILSLHCAHAYDLPKRFLFSEENALEEWQEKIFKNKVLYNVEMALKEEDGYLSAKSEKGCSGLFYKVRFFPKKFPMISWHWKVVKFPDKTKETKEKGGWIEKDDYAARVYVVFPSWIFTDTKSIEYIWDEELPEETTMASPYFGNIKLIVIESGRNNMGKWVFEERNIYEDYKKVFGRYPVARVGAIALMTDTDNTLSTAEASYKDMKVGDKNE